MVKSVLKKAMLAVSSIALALLASGAIFAAGSAEFSIKFDSGYFKLNRDAVKQETPENGAYRVASRLRATKMLTTFQIPDGSREYNEWSVTAKVLDAASASGGVAFGGDGWKYALYISPGGSAVMESIDGSKKVTWQSKAALKNFSCPAEITLRRDRAGNVTGEVNGVTVASRITNLDVSSGDKGLRSVSEVSFVTVTDKQGGSALYESLSAEASGKKATAALF